MPLVSKSDHAWHACCQTTNLQGQSSCFFETHCTYEARAAAQASTAKACQATPLSLVLVHVCADNLWFNDKPFSSMLHPHYQAPRCVPCEYQQPVPEHMPQGCPCTPQLLCQHGHPGLHVHNESGACGIPRLAVAHTGTHFLLDAGHEACDYDQKLNL